MARRISCCKDCKDRCVGCHSYCDVYLGQKEEHDKQVKVERYHKELRWGVVASNYHRQKTRFRKRQTY